MKALSLGGIIPPLLTPLHEDEALDEESLRRLIAHVLAGGVNGIFVFGSSGEGPMLRPAVRRRAVEVAAEAIAGRVPLLVGVSDCSVARVREQMEALVRPGVDAFVATLPYYGDFSGAAIQLRFFRQIADLSPRPLVLYNIPQAVHAAIAPATFAELAAHPNIVAIKDSSGNVGNLQRMALLGADSGAAVFTGAESIGGPCLLAGASGIIGATCNLAPDRWAELYRTAQRGDWEAVRRLQRRLTDLGSLCSHGYWLGCLKTAAHLMGLCGPKLASPAEGPDAEGVERIRQVLVRHGLLAGNSAELCPKSSTKTG